MLVTVAGLALVGVSSVLKPNSGSMGTSTSKSILGKFAEHSAH